MYDPSFDTGIHVVYGELETKIKEKTDKVIVEAVQKAGIDIDADRLEYILYNRSRLFMDGYDRGYNDAKSECQDIVHCNDCKHAAPTMFAEGRLHCKRYGNLHDQNWFCADGEREEGNQDG